MLTSDRVLIYLQSLRDKKIPIRIHGNGFIQIDVAPNARLHVWNETLIPRQKVYTGIHDHRFDFFSTCLWGDGLQDTLWIPTENHQGEYGKAFDVYHAIQRNGEDTLLVPNNTKIYDCNCWKVSSEIYPGRSYSCLRGFFHESKPIQIDEEGNRGSAITYMVKIASDKNYLPRVLCPVDQVPDNQFDRLKFSPDHCWEIALEIVLSWKS